MGFPTTVASPTTWRTNLKPRMPYNSETRYLTTAARQPIKNDELVAEVSWRRVFSDVVAGYCLAILIVPVYLIDVMKCDGPSMYPLFHPKGDVILVEKMSHRWFGIQDGDKGQVRAWAFRKRRREQQQMTMDAHLHSNKESGITSYTSHGLTYGDVVVCEHPLREGTVCKRIVALPGDEVIVPRRPTPTKVRIPDGHVWLEGDNKDNSTDSRSYGPVPAPLILGVVRLRLWPLRGEALIKRHCSNTCPLSDNHGNNLHSTIVIPAGAS
jgi:signal peptidase I